MMRSCGQYCGGSVLLAVVAVLGGLIAVPNVEAQPLPAPPQVFLDTSYPASTGTSIVVSAGGNLQSALNAAQPGDTILLQPGATYVGPFTLPAKSGAGWIVIRTSAPDSSLPPEGSRISPAYESLLPKIVAQNSSPAIQTATGAHHYRFTGVEIAVASGVASNFGLVQCGNTGSAQNSLSQVPYNFVFDRVWIHGTPTGALRRGVALNCASAAVIDSYISDVHEAGADSQAICGWNGPGPFKIVNNYLEGSAENVMFGGADPSIQNLVPSDIEIRGNHFHKPLHWKVGHPSYAGIPWWIKNLFELKSARRVLIEGNVFENSWVQADQLAFAIVLTPRNQNGGAPWTVVEDVTFIYNIIRGAGSGINVFGVTSNTQQTRRLLIANNLFENIDAAQWGGRGRFVQILYGTGDVVIDHNTVFHTGEILFAEGQAHTGFVYRNNLTPHNQYGVAGTGTTGNPANTLSTYFPGALFSKNVLVGGNPANYPANNFFPSTMADVLFVNFAAGNYRLQLTSPYRNAGTDGRDIGADIDSLSAITARVLSGGTPPGGPGPVDTTAPSVAITAPLAGATVSGTVSVAANASDNLGVTSVQFYLDGSPLGAVDGSAPYSTSWNTTTAAAGSHTLIAVAGDAAGNSGTSAPVTVTVANSQSPYGAAPFQIPGRFEAEDFDRGGEGLAYHDLSAGNQGGQYRTTEDVDIISPSAGVFAVNNFQTGEWLEYTIHVNAIGIYRLEALVSSEMTTGRFHIEVDGVDRTGIIEAPNTGLWRTFQWAGRDGIALTAGQHVLRIVADAEYFNFDAIQISAIADTTAPVVSITAPALNATVSNTVTISATATDNVAVAGVQFYLDGTALGIEDTTAPYSTTWDTTTAAGGSHTLSAAARDAAGNSATTPAVTVTVSNVIPDTIAPIVSITSPAAGTNVTGMVTISAAASDNVGVTAVQFYLDGAPLGDADSSTPYSTSWDTANAAAGSHTLTAVARDAAGNTSTSAPVTVTVPASSQSPYGAAPFQVPGRFEAEDFDRGGEGLAYHDLSAGNQGGQYRTTEDVDIISPSAGVLAVNNFQTGEWLEYTINVTTSGIYRLEALVSSEMTTGRFHIEVDGVDRTGIIEVPNTGFWRTFQWAGRDGVVLAAGQHIIRVHVDAEYFNIDALQISTIADTTAPAVSITAPALHATIAGIITLSALAADNVSVEGVQFYVDSTVLGGEDTTAPYSVSWDTSAVANGSHTLTAVARDDAGNRATSAAITVTVANVLADTTAPVVAITAPAAGASLAGTVTISASATDNVGVSSVRFFIDGVQIGEDTTSPFSISWDTTAATSAPHTLTAIARDGAGNSGTSAPVSVTVANAPPPPPPSDPTQQPYRNTPFSVPGTIPAEDFDRGGQGVAYYDLTPKNRGYQYRMTEDVDIISPYAGGFVVNNFQTGEWLEYTIEVTQSGQYAVEALISSEFSGSSFHIEVDGVDITGVLSVPNTGFWRTFKWVGKSGIQFSAGRHILRIQSDREYFDLDAIRVVGTTSRTRSTRP